MTNNIRLLIMTSVIGGIIISTAMLSGSGLTANNSGAPTSRTGSPGDVLSCTSCHTGVAQHVSGILSSNVPPAGYIPGNTYVINAFVSDANKNRFGFEISPQNNSGAKQGVITITDATRTKLIGSGKYITHTASGTSGTGSNSWSFNWTAPAAGTGDVTFYGAFNFSNHNNATSGDVIKLENITLHEDLNTSTQEMAGIRPLVLYPNPAFLVTNLNLTPVPDIITIQVFDMNGSLVQVFEAPPFSDHYKLDVTTFRSGTYYVSFTTDKVTYTGKLIKL
jgi:hypothetical protein